MSKRAKPDAGTLFEIHLRELGFRFQREYRFHGPRKWRADFLISGGMHSDGAPVLVEIEGGIWTHGAHVRGKHFLSDCEKYNTASALGYKVFRFSVEQIERGEAKTFLKEWLA